MTKPIEQTPDTEAITAEPHLLRPKAEGRNPKGRVPHLVMWLETEEGQMEFEKILTYIKGGAFEHVAAEAMGIDRLVWRRWKKEGRRQLLTEDCVSPWADYYLTFYKKVSQAVFESRMLAEVEVRQNDPKFWLMRGPGRGDNVDDPGWKETSTVEMHVDKEETITHQHLHLHGDADPNAITMEDIDAEERSINNFAQVLQLMEDLGMANPTPLGLSLAQNAEEHEPETIEGQVSVSSQNNGNGKPVIDPVSQDDKDDPDLQ